MFIWCVDYTVLVTKQGVQNYQYSSTNNQTRTHTPFDHWLLEFGDYRSEYLLQRFSPSRLRTPWATKASNSR